MGEQKRILVINVNWIGDVLFSTPLIRTLREAYPESYLACLLHPRTREMLESNPRLDEIIIYDEDNRHRGLIGKIRLIAFLRKKRFDTAFILHRSFTKALIAALAGIKERVGYPTKKRSFLLTKPVEESIEEIHKVEYFLNLAKAVGIYPKDVSYEFFIENFDKKFVKELLGANGVAPGDLLVVLCPGGNWDPKRWPKENFAKLADMLAGKLNAKIVIAGAKKDIGLGEDIKKMMNSWPIITCGKTTLKQLGALLERANLVIANDTGPMHMAVAMKTKAIALFGPTSPRITGPYGTGDYRVIFKTEDCGVPCYDFTCRDNKCMAAIKVDDVFAAAGEMLGKNKV